TIIGHGGPDNNSFDSIPYGGYYTQEQIRDIVDYASRRHITIVPEIDLPGHMQAALASYPELGCTGGPYEVWQRWGISDDVLCAGNDSIYAFIDDVLDEITELFPSEYIHIGGDECPKVRWEKCPKCQARIRQLGLRDNEHGTAEQQLQSHVMRHATEFLTERGRKVIGWDEILEGGITPDAIVMSWRGTEGGKAAAEAGHDAIMTPSQYLYFDFVQSDDRESEPLGASWGDPVTVELVYSYEPVPENLTPEQAAHIIGVQANLWTEYVPTMRHAQYMELPRLGALAEVQWSNAAKDYPAFLQRLKRLASIYDAEGYNYARHAFETKNEDCANETQTAQ
ncbi:MAG: family 20 glycosylhydrolase, partial [Muribaculaceae bacterium]|nr:family 20 glycosylhydrolase [Muribaculaceae bacterium]